MRTAVLLGSFIALLSFSCAPVDLAQPSPSNSTASSTAPSSTGRPAPAPSTKPPLAATTVVSVLQRTVPPSTEPPSTMPPLVAPEEMGLELAQALATALADGDWETARQISPVPEWDDKTYEEGFAGLEAATVFLGGYAWASTDRLAMYLLQVAHESRDSGPQTSLYCVRWDADFWTLTIDRVAGELLLREDGFTPPADAERGAWQCDRFDGAEFPSDSVGPITPGVSTTDEVPADWIVITYEGSDYVCEPTFFRYGDYDCVRFAGTMPDSITFTELWCSETLGTFDCTTDGYYPSDLDGYEILTYDGREYVCKPAWLGSRDYDCDRWFGGAPPIIITPDLRCSERPEGSFDCTPDGYYPSELDGLEVAEIDRKRVLCRGDQCWIWDAWVTPSQAMMGPADYVCSAGRCDDR